MTLLEHVPCLEIVLKNILITTSLQRQMGRVQTATSGCRNTRAAKQPARLFLRSAEHREPTVEAWWGPQISYASRYSRDIQ